MLIIGHRGAGDLGPENTLQALRKGIECADFVEVDLRLTKDGIPVAIHDASLDRTTDGAGPVKSYTIEELKRLDAGEGESIPALYEVLKLIRDSGSGLVAEIKEPGTEAIIVSVLMDQMPGRLILTSAYPDSVAMAKRLLPGVQAGLIYSERSDDLIKTAHQSRADVIFLRLDQASHEVVEQIKEAGLLAIVWALGTQDSVQRATKLDVDGIVADDPCAMRRYLQAASNGRDHSNFISR